MMIYDMMYDIIAYLTTSNSIWRFIPHRGDLYISHEVKLSGIYETKVWDKYLMAGCWISILFY